MADRVVVVTGFGPFLDVADNPSARLVEAVSGVRLGRAGADGLQVVGAVLPVSYTAAPTRALDLALERGACALVGLGVARGRTRVSVERWGRRAANPDLADVDGLHLAALASDGPDQLEATAPCAALAEALDAVVSEDAGGYVCNAWLYRVLRSLPARAAAPVAVAFIHIPPLGLAPERLLAALDRLWSPSSIAESPRPTT